MRDDTDEIYRFWINFAVDKTLPSNHEQWIIPFAIQLIPAGLLFIGVFCIKESPRWLFTRDNRAQGIRNLCWLRQLDADHVYIQEEVYQIDCAVEHQRSTVGMGFWQPFKAVFTQKKVLYRFLLGGSLFMWQNATGINAISKFD